MLSGSHWQLLHTGLQDRLGDSYQGSTSIRMGVWELGAGGSLGAQCLGDLIGQGWTEGDIKLESHWHCPRSRYHCH
jgi:hypothetical protein